MKCCPVSGGIVRRKRPQYGVAQSQRCMPHFKFANETLGTITT